MKYLQQNIELNQYAIKIHSYALSDYTGKGVVYLREGQNFTYTVTVNKNTVSPNFKVQKIDIDVMRIDKLIEEKVIQIPDLIKLDVERYEYEVLCGMGKYLKEFYPDLIVEVLDAQQACRLNQIFVGTEYIFFNIDDINQSIRQTKTIEPSVHGNNLICTLKTAINLSLIEKINTFSD